MDGQFSIIFWEEIGEGSFEQKFIEKEQGSMVVMVSYWLQLENSLPLPRYEKLFFLPADYVNWDEWYMHEDTPFMASRLCFDLSFLT